MLIARSLKRPMLHTSSRLVAGCESECAMRRGYRRPPFLTIGVWCSCWHSANCKLSIKVLVSALFIRICSSHISADICMFLMFAVNSLRVRRCWQSASLIAKYVRNALKLMPKSIQIHPKSVPNQQKWCQRAFRKRSREQVGSKLSAWLSFFMIFGATWAIWDVIWRPAGRQGALKIKLFGIKSH